MSEIENGSSGAPAESTSGDGAENGKGSVAYDSSSQV